MPRHGWSFLSHHGMVLVALARQADLRLSDLALEVGISPRAAQSIVTDLVHEGFLERDRIGRRNRYRVQGNRQLPDQWAQDRRIGELVGAIARRGRDGVARADGERQHALVLACSDHRYQRGLRELLGDLGLLDDAEVVLWPGGSAALTEPGGTVLLELIAAAVRSRITGQVRTRVARAVPRRERRSGLRQWMPWRSSLKPAAGDVAPSRSSRGPSGSTRSSGTRRNVALGGWAEPDRANLTTAVAG